MPTGDPIYPDCGQYLANAVDHLGVHHCLAQRKEVPLLMGVPSEHVARTVCVSGLVDYVEETEYTGESLSYEQFAAETEEKMREVLTETLQEWIETHDDATMVVPAVVREIMTRMRNEGLV